MNRSIRNLFAAWSVIVMLLACSTAPIDTARPSPGPSASATVVVPPTSTPAPTLVPTQPAPTRSPGATPTSGPTPTPPATPTPPPAMTGLGWTAVPLPLPHGVVGVQMADVAVIGNEFVAVGEGFSGAQSAGRPVFWRSSDGVTWDPVPHALAAGSEVDALAVWNGKLVAAGSVGPFPDSHAAFWTSADGIVWTRLPDSANLAFMASGYRTAYIADLRVVHHDLVATAALYEFNSDGFLVIQWRSSDGAIWQRTSHGDEGVYEPGAIPGGDGLIRWDINSDAIVTRSDTTDWRIVWSTGNRSIFVYQAIRAVANGYLMVGDQTADQVLPIAVYSADGLSWVESTGWPALATPGSLQASASTENLIVVVGDADGPEVWISPPSI